jgi:glycosyltransferase involved in cell wall biosynthesis
MPAYNAERTLRSAVDCLLDQTFRDFELIISDNASTDSTWSIIETYARTDRRVIGIRQETNIGANTNYSAVFRAARGRYFKWASSNDWCAPEFIERCVTHLDTHADAVLVAPRTRLFQDNPHEFTEYDADRAFEQQDAVDRFIQVGSTLPLNNVLNGLVRSDALRRTRLIEHYPTADVVLVAHLALLGKIALLHEPLFYRRMAQETATILMSKAALHRHYYPRRTLRSLFPAWRLVGGWMRVALSPSLPLADKARALRWVARFARWNSADLGRDLVDAMRLRFHA